MSVELTISAGVAEISLANPPINLVTVDVFLELRDAVRHCAESDAAAVVLRSADPAWFAAHYDVEAILDADPDDPPTAALSPFDRLCERLRLLPQLSIAAIAGRVGGGGLELALACDLRFAGVGAIFNHPEVALGIIPGAGGTVRLPRLIGHGRALEMIAGAVDVDGTTAERWGLVNRCLPDAEVDDFVDALARRIAAMPRRALALAKQAVTRADAAGADTAELLASETADFRSLTADPVSRAAMQRFLARGGQQPAAESRLGAFLAE